MICSECSTHLLSVGYSSAVTTSREFQAEILRPLYRQSMKIIMDSLVPNHRKKQLMPDSTMEPPAGHDTTFTSQTQNSLTYVTRGHAATKGQHQKTSRHFSKRKGGYL